MVTHITFDFLMLFMDSDFFYALLHLAYVCLVCIICGTVLEYSSSRPGWNNRVRSCMAVLIGAFLSVDESLRIGFGYEINFSWLDEAGLMSLMSPWIESWIEKLSSGPGLTLWSLEE